MSRLRSFGPFVVALALTAAGAAQAAQPVVVELFTSQGCSSCPPANATVSAMADRADVLALSFGVTYWDDLGWKDAFASPQYTARQWDYARGLRHSQVWTPQVVVDGRADTVGQSPEQIEPLIRDAHARRSGAPEISFATGQVTVAGAAGRPQGQVWLVRYDPRVIQVPIQHGENGGKTLPHRNVVRELVKLGSWSGQTATFPIRPPADPNLRTAVLVQSGAGGPILAAARREP
jgi:hypothetical protein